MQYDSLIDHCVVLMQHVSLCTLLSTDAIGQPDHCDVLMQHLSLCTLLRIDAL